MSATTTTIWSMVEKIKGIENLMCDFPLGRFWGELPTRKPVEALTAAQLLDSVVIVGEAFGLLGNDQENQRPKSFHLL